MSVREDAKLLYGFATRDEYDLFMLLISVNGVGPKVALGILSAASPNGFRLAVHQKNMKVLMKMPGIGKKTAERIILELHDKVGTAGDDGALPEEGQPDMPQGIAEEALAALCSLGYSSQEVLPAIESRAGQCSTVEQLITQVLRSLGSGR